MNEEKLELILEILEAAKTSRSFETTELGVLTKESLVSNLTELYYKKKEILKGTPEIIYLKSLIEYYDPKALPPLVPEDSTYDIRLKDLPFNARAINLFNSRGIHYVGELSMCSEAELSRFRNIGRATIKEIKGILEERGIILGNKNLGYIRPEKR